MASVSKGTKASKVGNIGSADSVIARSDNGSVKHGVGVGTDIHRVIGNSREWINSGQEGCLCFVAIAADGVVGEDEEGIFAKLMGAGASIKKSAQSETPAV